MMALAGFFYLVGIGALCVGGIMLLLNAIRRRPLKRALVVGGGGLAAMLVGTLFYSAAGADQRQTQVSATPATVAAGTVTVAPSPTPRPTPTVAPTPTPQPSVGSTLAKGNWQVSFTSAQRVKSLPGLFDRTYVPQGEFLVILATLTNIGKETYNLNSWDFNVLAPGDIKYKLSGSLSIRDIAGYETVWLSVTVQPGLSQKVRLIFDVPPGAKGLQLDVSGIRFAIPDS